MHILITQNYKKMSKDMSNNRSQMLHTGLEKGQLVMSIQEVIIFIQMRKTTTKKQWVNSFLPLANMQDASLKKRLFVISLSWYGKILFYIICQNIRAVFHIALNFVFMPPEWIQGNLVQSVRLC